MTAANDEVELERDHYWWLHPTIRGQQAFDADASQLPWRWMAMSEVDSAEVFNGEPVGPYGDFAKLLYKLNGYKPGPVTGWYVIVSPEPQKFAVGQLWVDPEEPLVLFSDHVYDTEDEARDVAAKLRQANPGLMHRE
ncbi:MAG: hypothetical protein ACPHUF_12540 [Gammaproteobacteria bacterium]|jgi:hypothetical protein|tara:strand:- start:335 stop:745 length:411 start_codon:yes stop_codon:yes gene_type:complete